MLGGFPYSWDATHTSGHPIASTHSNAHRDTALTCGNSANQEGYTISGCWELRRNCSLCQQLCPRLKGVRCHKVWAAFMSLVYLVIVITSSYNLYKIGFSEDMNAADTVHFLMHRITNVALVCLLFHLVTRSGGLAGLVSQLDTLPPGPSLYTWASIRAAHTFPLLVMFLGMTGFILGNVQKPDSEQLYFIYILDFIGNPLLSFTFLVLYNFLLYLLCVILAARVRDLRVTMENMRERKGVKGVHQVVGPVMCDLWNTQTLLNNYFGLPIMILVPTMIFASISNVYFILLNKILGNASFMYSVHDLMNLLYLCHAPGLVHDQVRRCGVG